MDGIHEIEQEHIVTEKIRNVIYTKDKKQATSRHCIVNLGGH